MLLKFLVVTLVITTLNSLPVKESSTEKVAEVNKGEEDSPTHNLENIIGQLKALPTR